MADEVPDGLAIETIWVLEATNDPASRERRSAVRREHLARIAGLMEQGVVVEAGGFADYSGSLLLLRVADEAAAIEVGRADPYVAAGVWTNLRARALGRVVRS